MNKIEQFLVVKIEYIYARGSNFLYLCYVLFDLNEKGKRLVPCHINNVFISNFKSNLTKIAACFLLGCNN